MRQTMKPTLKVAWFNFSVYFFSKQIKTDFAQCSSKKCKNYLLKNCSQHGNILNTIWNTHFNSLLQVTPHLNSQAFSRKLMSNLLNVLNWAGAILFWTDIKHLFHLNMDNFKFNFLSRGQSGGKSIGNLIFALTARTLSGNHLNCLLCNYFPRSGKS